MLPIKLIGPTKPFTPEAFFGIIHRKGDFILIDNRLDDPAITPIGLSLDVVLDHRNWVKAHFNCLIDDQSYRGLFVQTRRNLAAIAAAHDTDIEVAVNDHIAFVQSEVRRLMSIMNWTATGITAPRARTPWSSNDCKTIEDAIESDRLNSDW